MNIKETRYTERENMRPTLGVFNKPFESTVHQLEWLGTIDAARKHNVNLLTFLGDALRHPSGFHAQANVLYDLVNGEQVDGLIVFTESLNPYVDTQEMEALIQRFHPLPVVSVEKTFARIPSVVMDNYQGMREALVHLIEGHGYRRIIFIRGPAHHFGAQERYRAYIETLAEYGLQVDPNLVTPIGDWWDGAAMLTMLLDERKLCPRTDFDAVVGVSDASALAAIEVLQARGIKVPDEVAVVGFDDYEESNVVTPPLTSIRPPFYEMGWQAVETLVAMIAGEDVPESVIVPTTLMIRQSCGCRSAAVVQVSAGPVVMRETPWEAALTAERDTICAEIEQMLGTSERISSWVKLVVDAFMAEISGTSPGIFLSGVEEVLRQVAATHDNVAAWQDALSILHHHILPYCGDQQRLILVEILCQQARVLIAEITARAQAYEALQGERQVQILHAIEAKLITTFDLQGLMDILAEELPRLGIPGCYLVLYEKPQPYTYSQPAPEWSRVLLAYNPQGRLELESGGQRFLSRQLVPEGLFPQEHACHLVVESLYFREQQLGFVLFEGGPRNGKVYDTLRSQMSSAIQGALLVQCVQENAAEIARKNYILDTFMANVPDSIYFKDRESRFIRSNKAHATSFGVKDPTELLGKSDFDFFPEEHARPKYEVEQEIIRTGQPLLALEEPDAGGCWSLTTKMPLRDEHGEIIGTFGISRDITKLKHAQHELAAAYEEIRVMNEQLKEENVRMGVELNVARRLQQMILPSPEELQEIQGIDIVGFMQPADEVGGDYYDVLKENGVIHIGIGDVTGHGLESGVLMLMTQTAIRTLIEHGETDPVAFVNTLNRMIYKNARRMGADKTLTFALVEYQAGQLKIVGQHEEILVVRRGGRVERVDTMDLGFPIGLEEEITQWVASATVSLQPGDSVILYTDGITEAANMHDELYEVERLCKVISHHWNKSAEEIKQAVIDDVLRHIGKQKVYDDLTLVVLRQK